METLMLQAGPSKLPVPPPVGKRRRRRLVTCSTCVVMAQMANAATTAAAAASDSAQPFASRFDYEVDQQAWLDNNHRYVNGRKRMASIVNAVLDDGVTPNELKATTTWAAYACGVTQTTTGDATGFTRISFSAHDTWTKRQRTGWYATPVIIAISVLLFCFILVTLTTSFMLRRRRRKRRQKAIAEDPEMEKDFSTFGSTLSLTDDEASDHFDDEPERKGLHRRAQRKMVGLKRRFRTRYSRSTGVKVAGVDPDDVPDTQSSDLNTVQTTLSRRSTAETHVTLERATSRTSDQDDSCSVRSQTSVASALPEAVSTSGPQLQQSDTTPPAYHPSSTAVTSPVYVESHLSPRQLEKRPMPADSTCEAQLGSNMLAPPPSIDVGEPEPEPDRSLVSGHVATDEKSVLEALRMREEAFMDGQGVPSVDRETMASAPVIALDGDGFEQVEELLPPSSPPVEHVPSSLFPEPPRPVAQSFVLAGTGQVVPSAPPDTQLLSNDAVASAPPLDVSPSDVGLGDVWNEDHDQPMTSWLPIYEAESSAPPLDNMSLHSTHSQGSNSSTRQESTVV